MTNRWAKLAGFVTIALGSLTFACYHLAPGLIEELIARHLTRDGEIGRYQYQLSKVLRDGPLFLLCIGVMFLKLLPLRPFAAGARGQSDILSPNFTTFAIFFCLGMFMWAQSFLGCFFAAHLRPVCALYFKEGFYEQLTVFIFILAAVWLVVCARRSRSIYGRSENLWWRRVPLFYCLLAVFCFVVAMEEISWGQTFFRWSTPDLFVFVGGGPNPHDAGYNVQNETNVHNFFNDYFQLIYRVGTFVVLFFCFGVFMASSRGKPTGVLRQILPNPNLLGLAFWFPPANWESGEVVELLAAIFVLIYSWSASYSLKLALMEEPPSTSPRRSTAR